MNGEQFLISINEADDEFINESMPGISTGNTGTSRRKRMIAAVIAACLVVALGTVAYAAGWITKPLNVDRNIVLNNNGNESAGAAIEGLLDALKPGEIRGQIKQDALEQQADSIGNVIVYKEFSSATEVAEYIGCEALDTPYYPCDTLASVFYSGRQDLAMGTFQIMGSGGIDDIAINYIDMFRVDENGTPGNMGFGLEQVDGNAGFIGVAEVSEFETEKGINCKVSTFIHEGKISLQGFLTKNNIIYNISIDCGEGDQEKAMKILRDWAESF